MFFFYAFIKKSPRDIITVPFLYSTDTLTLQQKILAEHKKSNNFYLLCRGGGDNPQNRLHGCMTYSLCKSKTFFYILLYNDQF